MKSVAIVRELLTPKQVARAIDVSESSVKRWCDKGTIPTQYTAGGHRRIALTELLQFIRTGKHALVHPEALGLPATSGKSVRVLARAREQLAAALLAGDEPRCRQIAFDIYLAGHSLSVLFDDVIAAAFRDIGQLWSCGDAEVYQERRGCEITLRILHELRTVLPDVPMDAPIAIGGAPAQDQYSLGTAMAELVLREGQWNAISLGDNLPFETLAAAIHQHQPRLFWLSCSYIADVPEFLASYGRLYEQFSADVAIVVGGFALTDDVRQGMKFASYCDTMQHLESFAATLRVALTDTAQPAHNATLPEPRAADHA